ncbi:hypothetical protein ABZX62_00090 [Streptomyces flavidovirens]|uniref:hypothetical protein n=1 Tax=Streptomyces flavidovirens TaxID=67298 RepID=UPI0033A5AAF1
MIREFQRRKWLLRLALAISPTYIAGLGIVVLVSPKQRAALSKGLLPEAMATAAVVMVVLCAVLSYWLIELLALRLERTRRELEVVASPEQREMLEWMYYNHDELLSSRTAMHARALERQHAAERAKWLAEREEWKTHTMTDLYSQIMDQADRGLLCRKCQDR